MTSSLSTTNHLGIDPFLVIQQSNLRPTTKRQYARQLERYLATGSSLTDTAALINYAADLKPSQRVRFPLAALFRRRQVDRAVEIREIDHHAVLVDEPPPDFGVSLFGGHGGIGGECGENRFRASGSHEYARSHE